MLGSVCSRPKIAYSHLDLGSSVGGGRREFGFHGLLRRLHFINITNQLQKIMNLTRAFRLATPVLLLALTFTACNKSDDTPAAKDITDVAIADPQFSILVAALQKAELVQTLKTTGPFTVFAPTNAAFTAAGITDLTKFTKADLTPILLNHVLAARVPAASVASGEATTAGGTKIYLSKNASGVFINGKIKVTTADVPASNGVIHIVDNVILPPDKNLVQLAQANPNLKTLVSLVTQAGLGSTLLAGPFTVFAPTDAAFTELFKTVDATKLTQKQLGDILLYHVVPNRVFSSDLANGDVQTANPTGKVTVSLANGVVIKGKSSGDSKVTKADDLATNGVIHVIDKVLLP
jgi:uncharacterized surface protein with fasciclin (FAS1) repeats